MNDAGRDATDPMAGNDAAGEPRKEADALRVVPAGPPPGTITVPLGGKQLPPLALGCNTCGMAVVITRPSEEIVYVCSKCKQPFNVIRECRACGSKVVLTQDEYHATAPSGRRCPVCLEPVKK